MTQIEALHVRGARCLVPEPHGDDRGWFARYFCSAQAHDHGLETRFVQFNQSFSREAGTIRGMHLQIGEGAEAKLIKCVRGRVFDALLDLRRGSPTLLQYCVLELSAANRLAVYIPPGVAHGFQTLEADSELIYHHTNFYMPETERGVRYDDPRSAIRWPLPPAEVSSKDRQWPLLTASFTGYDVG